MGASLLDHELLQYPQTPQTTLQLVVGIGLLWWGLELLSRLLLRPPLLRLLRGNPRLAGDAAKQEAAAKQMHPRVVCFVHNLVQLPLAFALLADPALRADTCLGRTPLSALVMAVSAGYFLYDSVECAAHLQHEGADFLLHGVMCLLVYTSLLYSGIMHYFGAAVLLWELSTPFMHLRWFLYKIGREHTRFYALNALTGMAVFFGCRIVWGNFVCLKYWRDSHRALRTAGGAAALPLAVVWFYRVATVVMNSLNGWWFSKMVALLRKALREKAAGRDGAAPLEQAGGEKQE